MTDCHATAASSKAQLGHLQRHLIFWPVAIVGLALDLATKKLVFSLLQTGGHIQIIPGLLQLRLALNDGAAFSLAAGKYWVLVSIGILAFAAVIVWLFVTKGLTRLMSVGLGMIAAGIGGNLYDRLFNNGLVRDFIDLYVGRWHWPTFNIADTLLCIGVGCWFLASLLTDRPCQRHDLPRT
ncbi:MAG: signal peptidase II [Sedimentisphaerales bacterium]|jgi:signal peptidase II|nr:signal peptidase II [Sedimentisphaerales bacterium]